MKPDKRTITKWRKKKPMVHRSFAIKRGRQLKHIEDEIEEYFIDKEGD